MQICRVVGHIWATKKESSLEGMKLMVLRACRDGIVTEEELVAADLVGAGIGEDVIVVSGKEMVNEKGAQRDGIVGADCPGRGCRPGRRRVSDR